MRTCERQTVREQLSLPEVRAEYQTELGAHLHLSRLHHSRLLQQWTAGWYPGLSPSAGNWSIDQSSILPRENATPPEPWTAFTMP
jgi:hypothetical protein